MYEKRADAVRESDPLAGPPLDAELLVEPHQGFVDDRYGRKVHDRAGHDQGEQDVDGDEDERRADGYPVTERIHDQPVPIDGDHEDGDGGVVHGEGECREDDAAEGFPEDPIVGQLVVELDW